MRAPIIHGCVIAVVIGLASPAAGQSTPAAGRFAASATVGVSMPIDSAMSDVYGGLVPVTGQVDVRLKTPISLFGGVKYLRADGQTVIVGTKVLDESYATSFHMTSVRLGAQVAGHLAPRWVLAGGAGVSFAWYEETWPDAGQSVNDRATGFLALAEGRYTMTPRWSVLARVEYAAVPHSNGLFTDNSNLGGFDLSAGVRFIF